jgi:hypothetical protein
MRTEELIDTLTADMRPAPPRAVSRRLATAVVLGAVLSVLLLWTCFGMRNDMSTAVLTGPFWMKWAFVLAGAVPAFLLARRLAQPDGRVGWVPLALITPVAVLGVVAVSQLASVPPPVRTAAWLGESARACTWMIGALSIPLLIVILGAFRRCAPTRLSLAGFAAGLLAGTIAGLVYALCCQESKPAFIVTWYTLGMLLPALLGAALGPRLLRW